MPIQDSGLTFSNKKTRKHKKSLQLWGLLQAPQGRSQQDDQESSVFRAHAYSAKEN